MQRYVDVLTIKDSIYSLSTLLFKLGLPVFKVYDIIPFMDRLRP